MEGRKQRRQTLSVLYPRVGCIPLVVWKRRADSYRHIVVAMIQCCYSYHSPPRYSRELGIAKIWTTHMLLGSTSAVWCTSSLSRRDISRYIIYIRWYVLTFKFLHGSVDTTKISSIRSGWLVMEKDKRPPVFNSSLHGQVPYFPFSQQSLSFYDHCPPKWSRCWGYN